jgi:translation initiation factor 3 subunit D
MAGGRPAFKVPEVVDNTDGWGPSVVPSHLKEVPYAPFGKGDKLGKASDWTGQGYQRYRDRFAQPGGSNAVFSFFHAVRPIKSLPRFSVC